MGNKSEPSSANKQSGFNQTDQNIEKILFVLASQSPYRKQQLQTFLGGLSFRFIVAHPLCDEDKLKTDFKGLSPELLSVELAKAKAKSLISTYPNAIIIGCDQIVVLEGSVLGKPKTKKNAMKQLTVLQNRKHSVVTSLAVWRNGTFLTHTDVSTLSMRKLTEQQINKYLQIDKPFDCAGSYKIEGVGIGLFTKIESQDPTAVIGLPLIGFHHLLLKMGIELY